MRRHQWDGTPTCKFSPTLIGVRQRAVSIPLEIAMQFTQISPSVSAQNPSVFKFGQNEIRVFQKDLEPWFLAADVCKALELTNPTASLKVLAPNEKTKIDIGRPEKANVISESGLYVLILRCQDAIKEGSIAYQFRIWVTKEVLPTIRKTGQYSATEKSSEVVPLTPRQQYKIQRAVAERAKGSHVHFNTIYKAIKIYFKVAKYDQIPASRFDECINFIQTVDLRIPEVLSDQPVEFPKPQLPSCPHCELITRGNLQQASVKEIQQLTIDARNALAEIEKERIRVWTCLHEIVFKLKVFA
jgi:prophage antirepressor-like protein